MALELKTKSTFLAVELLVFIPSIEEYINLKKEVYKFGREYYFTTKQLNKHFMYYHINTFETSGSFSKIMELSIAMRKFLLAQLPEKDFMLYAFTRVLENDKPVDTEHYQKRIVYLYKNRVLRSFLFVDNYIHNEMRDDYDYKKVSEKEFLLMGQRKLNKYYENAPIIIGRETQIEFIKKVYEDVYAKASRSGFIDISSSNPNLIGIKAAPGVGKTSFINAIVADLSYNYSNDFFVISKLTRNNGGVFHPFLTMLSELLDFKIFNQKEENKEIIINKKMEYFENYIDKSDLTILRHSLEYIYMFSNAYFDEEVNDIERFSVSIMSVFNALIKIVYQKEKRPFIFIFENIHRYSKESLLILENILKNFSMIRPVMFILTYNFYYDAGMFEKFSIKEVTLDTFDLEDTKNFVSTFAPMHKFSPASINDLYLKSCGHPYYIERYLTKVIEGVYTKNQKNEYEFPENIQSVICGKLHYIPDNLHYILQILSIIGDNFDVSVFKYILGKTDFRDTDVTMAISELTAYDIITSNGGKIAFKTLFYKTAIYETIPFEIKQQLHRLFAEYNEDQFKEQKTHKIKPIYEHYLLSNTPEKGIPYLVYKIEELADENKIADAKNLINYGLKNVEKFNNEKKIHENRVRLHLSYVNVLAQSGETRKERKLIDKIESEDLSTIKNQNIKTIHNLKQCYNYFESEKYSQVYDLANEIIPEFEKQNDKINLINAFLVQAQSAFHLKGGKTALSLYNRAQNYSPTQLQLAQINANRGRIYQNMRYYSESIRSYYHAYTVYGEYRRPYSQYNAGYKLAETLTMIGDYQNALIVLNYLLNIVDSTNNIFDKINVTFCIACIYNYTNNFTNANKFFLSTLNVIENFKTSERYCEVMLEVVEFYLKYNKLDDATKYMEIVMKLFEKTNRLTLRINLITTKALFYLHKNNIVGSMTALNSIIEDVLKADMPDKEFYLNKSAFIIEQYEKQNEKFKYKSAVFYKRAIDFVIDKMAKVTEPSHKQLIQENHFIDSKIMKSIHSPF